MKILYINSVYGKGSTGNIVRTLHLNNLSNGIDSFVCYGRGTKIKDKNVFKTSFELLSKINALRSKLTGMVYSGNLLATRCLIKHIKRIKPDIIHIHNLNDQYVNEYKLLKFLGNNKIKTIITLHSEQMYTGSCGCCFDCTAWKNGGCIKCPYLKQSTNSMKDSTKRAFVLLEKSFKTFNKNCLLLTSVSKLIQNRANESLLLKDFNNILIPNGVSKEFVFNDKNLDENNPVINDYVLYINPRMKDSNKGYHFINQIYSKLDNKIPFVIVGDYSGIEKVPGVTYLGPIFDKEVLANLYSKAKVTILLSKNESYSMVTAESLSCGTPVVSFKCGGPEGTFSDKYVKFVNYGDVDSLIKELINISIDRKEVIHYAKEKLSEESMISSYSKIYGGLL